MFCICENKDADQLREADQRLCATWIEQSLNIVLSKLEDSSIYLSSVAVQPVLCPTWLETQKTGFLATKLIYVSKFPYSS